jgi:hypothetical protein
LALAISCRMALVAGSIRKATVSILFASIDKCLHNETQKSRWVECLRTP